MHGSQAQQTQGVDPTLGYCWTSVVDGRPTLGQHLVFSGSRATRRYFQSKREASDRCCFSVEPALQTMKKKKKITRQSDWHSLTLTLKTVKPPRCNKASYYISENIIYFPTTKGLRTKISRKLVYQ